MASPDRSPPLDDVAIARSADRRPIEDVAADLGLAPDDVERYGAHKAKLTREAVRRALDGPADGRLVLVTGITPTTRGEGKTVVAIGLGQALAGLGERSAVALREPSLGPVFGMKGGAAGGGRAQVVPMEDINLHFTGDLHAVTAAHNLLAAMLDAHLHHGNPLGVDVDRVRWPRALDVNDRALREVVVGLGGPANGPPRASSFVITAASEVMAVLGLATDLADLEARLARLVVALDRDGEPVTAGDLEAAGAMTALLRDALRPNLVQTLEGSPALVHGGPFANIAHGTNTLLADRVGLAHADYLVTEAGFGADLGAEKVVDLVGRAGVQPDVAVLVATVRGLKRHGHGGWPPDFDALAEPDPGAVRAGLPNLDRHLRTLEALGLPAVVAVNRFPDDADEELAVVLDHCEARGVPAAVADVHARGGAGGVDLARHVRDLADRGAAAATPLYDLDEPLEAKLRAVATRAYGAADVAYTDGAREDLAELERLGFGDLPVCVSKTPYSLTDDPAVPGAPGDWTLTVRSLYPQAGAGFVVALTGDVLAMPGLPAEPAARRIGVDPDGAVRGLG